MIITESTNSSNPFMGVFCHSNLARDILGCLVFIFLLLAIFLVPTAYAHNVVSGVYADGMLIEGEVGFSNGDMAEAGSPVKVYNARDELIGELVLDEAGAFAFEAKTVARHVFKANLSAGHIAEMVVEANELTAPITMDAVKAPVEKTVSAAQQALANVEPLNNELTQQGGDEDVAAKTSIIDTNISVEQLESIIRSAVAQQVRPLQKDLRAYKEKVMFRDITGGLGFIFGLFGVAAWMASRRKEEGKNATVS